MMKKEFRIGVKAILLILGALTMSLGACNFFLANVYVGLEATGFLPPEMKAAATTQLGIGFLCIFLSTLFLCIEAKL